MRARIVFGYHVFSGICVDLPGLKTSGLPRAIGVRARLPPMKSKSAMHKAASRWLNTLCISLGKNSLLFGQCVHLPGQLLVILLCLLSLKLFFMLMFN